eukprot:6180292-Pleurochrysis_carterae.AAC.1
MPIRSSSSANSVASRASPSMTGTIGWFSAPVTVNPACVSEARKAFALSCSCRTGRDPSRSIRKTSSEAPTTAGAIEFEKRYGRARWRRRLMTSFLWPSTRAPREELGTGVGLVWAWWARSGARAC